MMLLGYFIIGQIQEVFPDYFGNSIEEYCKRARELSGFCITPWVEGEGS